MANPVWQEVSSKHFVAQYVLSEDRSLAQKVLKKAEYYYDRIADKIGYKKYNSFWTWNHRVKIVIFPDQGLFAQVTGQPVWSQGYASYHSLLFDGKSIVTYKQNEGFLTEILPHEITHLIIYDYLGGYDNIPLWFNEGVAQLDQPRRLNVAYQVLDRAVPNKAYIPFEQLNALDIRGENDSAKVAVFYAQSLSIVKFLIRRYGQSKFQKLFRLLKQGESFNDALRKTYRSSFENLSQLEKRWVQGYKY